MIAESTYTHSGQPKNLFLTENLHLFEDFRNKIKIIVDSKNHFTKNPRVREQQQRESISKFLKSFSLSKTDIIIHSDCDEIPRGKLINKLLESGNEYNLLLELDSYSTRLNLYTGPWLRCRIVSGHLYKSIMKMRQDIFLYNAYEYRRHNIPIIRVDEYFTTRRFGLWKLPKVVFAKPKIEIISKGGWHFNNLYPLEDILYKIEASSANHLNTAKIRQSAPGRYNLGQDIYFGTQYMKVAIDDTFPECVRNNLAVWSEFILQ